MIRRAVILAGGAGTRLASAEPDRAKVLVEIGGRPLLAHHLDLLRRHGVTDVTLTVGHLAEQVAAFVACGVPGGMTVRLLHEDRPLGTAGALAALRGTPDDLFVLYGDVAVNMDLTRLAQFHRARRAAATLVAHPNAHPYDSDLIDAAPDGAVRRLLPAKGRADGDYRNLVSAALYVLAPRALEAIVAGEKQDFVRDLFPRLLAAGEGLAAYVTPEYLHDMGTPDRLEHVRADVAAGRFAAGSRDVRRPAVFLDRDGVLNREVGGVFTPDALELLPGAAQAVREINAAGYLAVLVTNQPWLAKGMLTAAGLDAVHRRLETLLGRERAFLDAIYVCPHHPERGFAGEVKALKVACTCRKPAPGMLVRAAEDLPIDLLASTMVGDTWRDVAAGRAAGVRTIGIAPHGTWDAREVTAMPDALANDLAGAVRTILAHPPALTGACS